MQHTIRGLSVIPSQLTTASLYSDWLIATHTSEANDSLFFSPPEIPRSRPGIPMYVSAHFVRPSFGRKTNGNRSPYSLDSIWFRRDRFGWQFYFRLPNWHFPSSPRRGLLYIPPRNKSKNFLPLPFHSTCRNPIMFVGEEREKERKERHFETKTSCPKM